MTDTATPCRTARLAGVDCTFACADPRFFAQLDPWLALFLAEGDDESAAALSFAFDTSPTVAAPPPDLVPLVEYYYVTGYRRGALLHFRTAEGGWVELDATAGTARGALPEALLSGPPWPLRDLFNAAFTSFLRARGRYALHGAALARPEGGLLIVGSAMAGKTTLSLNLVRRGWQWIADDKIVLRDAEPGAPRAAGLLAQANVDPELARWFPELAGLSRRPPVFPHTTKRAVRLAELADEGAGTAAPRATTPRWLLFPRVEDLGGSRVTPMTQEEAFLELVRQSPLVNDRAAGRAQLDLLGRLTRHARAWRLVAARDLLAEPECLAALARAMELPLDAPRPLRPPGAESPAP